MVVLDIAEYVFNFDQDEWENFVLTIIHKKTNRVLSIKRYGSIEPPYRVVIDDINLFKNLIDWKDQNDKL